MEALGEAVADFAAAVEDLKHSLRAKLARNDERASAWEQAMLAALDGLEALRLPQLGDVGGTGEAVAGQWREAMREAAAADALALATLAGGDAISGSVTSEEGGQQVGGTGDGEADESAAAAEGTYHHWVRAADEGGAEAQAIMTPVPQAYRELVGAYFRRLSVDERRAHER